jgi:hypothetical protein
MTTTEALSEAMQTAALYAEADPQTRTLALKVLRGDHDAKKQAQRVLKAPIFSSPA